jgi:cysteinyl-tRNA synthetase
VLWKAEEELFWDSPWGNGRPGWHIECSALAAGYLGEQIDIHGGGLDLIFPHHENEKAQSESRFSKPFVRCWMHNGLVTVNHEKMSKSLGNFITLQDLLTAYDPMVVRYYFLTFHYKAPAEFLHEGLVIAAKNYERMVQWGSDAMPMSVDKLLQLTTQSEVIGNMYQALCDDLNTPAFFGLLFEHIKTIKQGSREHRAVVMLLKEVLGLTLQQLQEKEIVLTEQIKRLIQEREQARRERNWQKADELRKQLVEQGYVVKDEKV